MKDTRLVELQNKLRLYPARQSERDGGKEAAVAVLLRPREQLELLLIKRAVHEKDPWSGHVALPGGRRDANDVDLIQTAIRETFEEVQIEVDREISFIGALDEVAPRTPRLPPLIIAPFVFGVPEHTEAVAAPSEVETAVWVPVSAFRDEGAASEILIELEGGSRSFPSLKYGDYVIWGLTHRILLQFLDMAV
ncbi:MAG TPA: CoA pyrophosphatase [Longimicrobiales bacterium]|nr:CoA pyrophosphatase [Longimicrobiales bacterium]